MGDKPKAEVPFTFVTKVLQSYIDRINDIDKKAHFDTTTDTRKKNRQTARRISRILEDKL